MTIHLALVPGLNNTHAVFSNAMSALPKRITPHALNNPALETVEDIAAARNKKYQELRAGLRGDVVPTPPVASDDYAVALG